MNIYLHSKIKEPIIADCVVVLINQKKYKGWFNSDKKNHL